MTGSLRLGIALKLAAAFFITAMSAAVHHAAQSLPVGQVVFWRSLFALVPICAVTMLRREFPSALSTRRPWAHALRAGLGVAAMGMAFGALALLPVAIVEALGFLAPIFALPLAWIALGEPMTRPVIIATGLGLAGVLAVLWHALHLPQEGAVLGVALGLGFAVVSACVRVLVRAMTGTERPAAIAFYFAVAGSVAGGASAWWGWAPMTGGMLGWLALAGLFGGLAHICASEALMRAPVGVLGPFEYTGLIWAVGFDAVLFSVLPGLWGWVGMAAITASGLIVLASRR